jgi:hypothetical protein
MGADPSSGSKDPAEKFDGEPRAAGGTWTWPPEAAPSTVKGANDAFADAVNTLLDKSPIDTGYWEIVPAPVMYSACSITADAEEPFKNIGRCIIDGLSVTEGGAGIHNTETVKFAGKSSLGAIS